MADKKTYTKKLSFDGYLENPDSEDTIYFTELIKKKDEERKKKCPWSYKEESVDTKKKKTTVPSIEEQAKQFKRVRGDLLL